MTIVEFSPKLENDKLHLPPTEPEILDITYDENPQDPELNVYSESLMLPFAASSLKYCTLKNADYLCKGEDIKTVIEITINNEENLIKFKAGDTIGILPQNDSSEVEYLVKRLKLEDVSNCNYSLSLKNVQSKKKISIPQHIPEKGKLKDVLTSCLDIRGIMKKTFLHTLSKYTDDPKQRRCLEELCSKEGSSLYSEHILNRHTSIIDILKNFPSCDPPITILLQYLPRLMPRPYSICNSYDTENNVIKFCFSIVSVNNHTKGIATGWMDRLSEQLVEIGKSSYDKNEIHCVTDKIENLILDERKNKIYLPIYLRKSNSFCLPSDSSKPIVMIALGTGVAPFVGFLSERRNLIKSSSNKCLGEAVLYFGCRYRNKDFIYKEALEQFLEDKSLTTLRLSHSRDPGAKSKYVQDNIFEDAERIVQLIEEKEAYVYLCGDINKLTAVIHEALLKCLCKVKNIDVEEAKDILDTLRKNNRLLQDVWS